MLFSILRKPKTKGRIYKFQAFKSAVATGNPRRGFPNRARSIFLPLFPLLRFRTIRSFAHCDGRLSGSAPKNPANFCKSSIKTFTLPSPYHLFPRPLTLKLTLASPRRGTGHRPARWKADTVRRNFYFAKLCRNSRRGLSFKTSSELTHVIVHCQLSIVN